MESENLFARLFAPDREPKIAIVCEQGNITYAELRTAVEQAARTLLATGVQPGDRVAILLPDTLEFVASFVAIISLGGIAVPINLALRRPEQIFILRDCRASVAFSESETAMELFTGAETSEHLRHLILTSRAEDADIPNVKTHYLETRRAPDFVWPDNSDARAQLNADAFILYTSGSTGEPKGAVHTQAHIFRTNETYAREVLNLREGDRLFSSSRLPFAYGLGNSFTFPLLNGLTTILCREKPTPEVIARVFDEHKPTIFFGVPVVYRMLLEHHGAGVRVPASVGSLSTEKGPTKVGPLNTASLRLCVSAGEALPAQLGEEWQKLFGIEVLDGIGSTEMLHMFMSNHEGDLRYGSSGRVLKGYHARLIDHEGVMTPAGEVGNLWIRGESAATRYWERPDTTRETFFAGWVRTGDLYRRDDDGFWWHMGRSDDCFKPTGQWVSPVEVEGVLVRHPKIAAAAVVEGFDKDGLSYVCAVIVGKNAADQTETEAELRRFCETLLPRFKQPRRYVFRSELPYTATGKVQRFKLREELRAERL